ncbi:MAG: O-antigen ligase family protein [Akkermansia sp.]|nr:O-antigen ligase family protein [Akkermansia sp.]
MPNPISQKRLTETFAGRTAALLLALIWIASMGMTDINAYSYFPTMAGLIVVLLLALSAMIRGARAVQLSWLAWCSLSIGGYFLARCLCSFDVVSSWREAGLILSCGVFYVAGIYAAQGRSLKPTVGVLLVAVVLHIICFLLMKYTDAPLEWTGRPAFGPGGANHRPVTLFVYKNQAGAFLMISGMLLVAAALWAGMAKRIHLLIPAAVGVAAVALSNCCGTRAVLLLAPVMGVLGWVVWVVLKVNTEDNVGFGVILSGFLILGGIGFGLCTMLFDREVLEWVSAINTHDRYDVWLACIHFIHGAPLWGYGADSVPWLLVPVYDQSHALINFAHNEYLQAWVDYGIFGLSGVLFILAAHLLRGGRILLFSQSSATQLKLTALALLGLTGWSIASFVDFYWHHISVASLTAFCLGCLASPYAYERRGRIHRVQVQGAVGKGILAVLICAVIGGCAWLGTLFAPSWEQQWAFNRLASSGADKGGTQRMAIINSLLPKYPSHRLADTAYSLPCSSSWAEEETMLLHILKANPHQLFMVAMLGHLYTEQGRYEDAEKLYRRYYPGDGMPVMWNAVWPSFYYLNLMSWAQDCKMKGDMPGAYSRMRFALGLNGRALLYKGDFRVGDIWYLTPEQRKLKESDLRARQQDVKLFEILGVEPDDSWMEPMEPGGKPALYRRFGLADVAERKKVAEEVQKPWRLLRQNP